MYDGCSETPKSSLPTKDTWLLNKTVFRRLSKELQYKTKIFCSGNEGFFIHEVCMCEGVSEGSGHWHGMRAFMKKMHMLLLNVFVMIESWHCMCT